MIQDSKILKWFKEHQHQRGWFVTLFTQPKLYLYNLLNRTFVMGFVLFVVYEVLKYFQIGQTQSIPSSIHSLVGIVIGLLLVFRTNTAYDRWWEARRIFSSLHATFLYFIVKSKSSSEGLKKSIKETVIKINADIFNFVSTDDVKESEYFKSNFLKHYEELGELFHKTDMIAPVHGSVERKMSEVLDQFSSLERIRNTPIPISYSFHIKLSVFLYLLTLPFGLFFELHIWSIPCVMALFFIIAGIEIISNEIENPFKGDPNDLPIDDFKSETEKYINGTGKEKEAQ